MQLHEVILYVQEMQLQVSFYRDVLGLKLHYPQDKEDFSEEYWVVFDTGACKLALHGGGNRQPGQDAPKIVFQVEEIEASRQSLIVQGVEMSDVRSPAPGVLVVDGQDPEGNRFSLESYTPAEEAE